MQAVPLLLGGRIAHEAVSRFNQSNFTRLRRFQTDNIYPANMYSACQPAHLSSGYLRKSHFNDLWGEMHSSFVDQGDQKGIAGYSSNTLGFGVGFDRHVNKRLIVGFGFSGSFTEAEAKHDLGGTSADQYIISLYGSRTNGPWTISASGGYVYSNLKTRWNSPDPTLGSFRGSSNADSLFAGLELNHRFGSRNRYFTPFYAMDFIFYNEDGYTATGINPMNVEATSVFGYLQTFGARMGTQWRHGNGWVFNPELLVGWVHDYGHGNIAATGYVGANPYGLLGPSRNTDRAHLGLGLNTAVSSRMTMFARYDGQLASDYNSHTLQAGLSIRF